MGLRGEHEIEPNGQCVGDLLNPIRPDLCALVGTMRTNKISLL